MDDDNSVIQKLQKSDYEQLKANGAIHTGMIPKLDNAFNVLKNGVSSVVICGVEGVNTNVGTTLKE